MTDSPAPRVALPWPFRLSRDPWGRVVLIAADGREFVDVEPIRLFPLTAPTSWIAICDEAGHELVCIDDLSTLDAGTRQTLELELQRREFAPIIERIISVSSNTEPSEWTVETDRGRTKFVLKNEEDIRRLGTHGVLILDAHRIRYVIPDERQLDAASKRVVEWYV